MQKLFYVVNSRVTINGQQVVFIYRIKLLVELYDSKQITPFKNMFRNKSSPNAIIRIFVTKKKAKSKYVNKQVKE